MRIQNFKRYICVSASFLMGVGVLSPFSYADRVDDSLRGSIVKMGREDQASKQERIGGSKSGAKVTSANASGSTKSASGGSMNNLEITAARSKATTSAASRGIAASVAGQAAKAKTSVAHVDIKVHKDIPNLNHVSGKDIKPKPKVIPPKPLQKPRSEPKPLPTEHNK